MTAVTTRHIGHASPVWQQLLINYGIGRLYHGTAGPWIRQHVEAVMGHKKTPAYKPPLTPGFLVRDLATTATGLMVNQRILGMLNGATHAARAGVARNVPNLLTTSAGIAGATAGAAAGQITMAALRKVAGQTVVMTLATTAIDAMFANKVGPKIESTVNGMLGLKASATVQSKRNGTVPSSTVKTSPEQFVRNFSRSLTSSLTYSTVLSTVGTEVGRAVAMRVAGPGGALLGGIAGAIIAGAVVSVEDRLIGQRVANVMQDVYRGVAKLAGKKVGKKQNEDVIPVAGDRVSWAIGGALIPFGTAALTGQQSAYSQSVSRR